MPLVRYPAVPPPTEPKRPHARLVPGAFRKRPRRHGAGKEAAHALHLSRERFYEILRQGGVSHVAARLRLIGRDDLARDFEPATISLSPAARDLFSEGSEP